MNNLDLSTLDPNIRRVVAFLRSHGFETTDSGDGSKVGMDCAMDAPNVAMVVDPRRMAVEANRLRLVLEDVGVEVRAMGEEPTPCIQVAYDPCDGHAVLMLLNVDDSMMGGQHVGCD